MGDNSFLNLSVRQKLFVAVSACCLLFSSCKKDYVYEVNDVTVTQPGGNKNNVKSTVEFIAIAYADLFESTIPTDSLINISIAYESFGDKKLIEDMIIRHFLNSPLLKLPSDGEMRSNTSKFIEDAVLKLYNRKPDDFEKYYIGEIIHKNAVVSPVTVYYSLMTSDEYRYY